MFTVEQVRNCRKITDALIFLQFLRTEDAYFMDTKP